MREEVDTLFIPHRPIPIPAPIQVATRITRGLLSARLIYVADGVFVGFIRRNTYFNSDFFVSLDRVIASAAVFVIIYGDTKFG